MNKEGLVSVIIPCYNAEKFVAKTITSVLTQSYQLFEIIIIDDGSTDNSATVISKINDSRILFFKTNNSGVSSARNTGFNYANGEYVLFLDADDILSHDFLEKRIQYLIKHPKDDFCFSNVVMIDENDNQIKGRTAKGAGTTILKEVMSYDTQYVTCPSNYLFRKNKLYKYSIKFNSELSSSADRLFLIELSQFLTGIEIKEGGHLLYRVHQKSMSNFLTLGLIKDNYLFQQKVRKLDYIPKDLKSTFLYKTNYILAGSYFKIGKYRHSILFLIKAFYYDPFSTIRKLIN